jgi:putative transcriptional regulator
MKNRLHVLRAEHGWSQADLAQRLNVSRQTVNAIENERYDPSLPLAFAIARVFETTIERVFDPDAAGEVGIAAPADDAGDHRRQEV